MRNLHLLDIYRDTSEHVLAVYGNVGGSRAGAFWIPSPVDHQPMRVIASAFDGWDHVSVSRKNRCPNWPEMSHVKHLFFKDDETAMQLHVPVEDHISFADTCLHLWRPVLIEIPRPPGWMVSTIKTKEPA